MTFRNALPRLLSLTLTCAALAAVAVGPAVADRGPEKVRPIAEKIRPVPDKIRPVPVRPVDIEVWTDRGENGRYCVGESISIYFRATEDAWVSILNTDTRGRTHRLFPNRWDREHFVEAGRVYRLPIDGYRFEVEGPPGREALHAIAAHDRYELRRAADRLIKGFARTGAYGPRAKPYSDPREKIAVVPVAETVGYDTASHLVRDGRRCAARSPRPWWYR
ncbi:MAG: DUF4384 domain-containing protein [Acidobacteriota bacterium]